ncbi:MAG: hypothetical protein ABFC55_10600 [Tenuifilaceae bacterium]
MAKLPTACLLAVASIFALCHSACVRDDFSESSALKLSFSADTVLFDTVFTTIGSSTQYFKVYNRSGHDLHISSIRLAGGSTSPYRINVDGRSGVTFSNVSLRSRDSLFVFVEVTVDPTSLNSPLLVADSIMFSTNGNIQDVKLVAWGQDVHLLRSEIISNDTVLATDKPYLIYSYLLVDTATTLTIPAGVQMYFHNQAMLVVAGTLKVEGEQGSPVVMEGDRLEDFYRDKAGQWGGIWLTAGSRYSAISWAEIKNAITGITVDTCFTSHAPTLTLSHTRIENCSYVGLLARGAKVKADNCLVSNAAQVCVALTMGGEYRFYHCTVANYWGDYIYRKGPALLLNNYYLYRLEENGPLYVEPRDLVEASFFNSIVYGSMSSEFQVDNIVNGAPVAAQMNYHFEDCILKVPQNFDLTDTEKFTRVFTLDPKFKDSNAHVFLLDTLSPAMGIANPAVATDYPIDLNGFNRLTDGKPDLGAYERQE